MKTELDSRFSRSLELPIGRRPRGGVTSIVLSVRTRCSHSAMVRWRAHASAACAAHCRRSAATIRIADEIFDGGGSVSGLLPRAGDDGTFVLGEAGALVEEAADLALELAHRPAAEQAFIFVERALPRIVEAEEFDEVGPGELKNAIR